MGEVDAQNLNIFNVIDSISPLYYYREIDGLQNILESGQILFNSMAKFNDPKEALLTIYHNNDIPCCELKKFYDYFYNNIQIVCFSLDDTKSRFSENKRKKYFLGYGFNKSTMWAHYADTIIDEERTGGACIILDKSSLEKELELVKTQNKIIDYFSGKINYVPFLSYTRKRNSNSFPAYLLRYSDFEKADHDGVKLAIQKIKAYKNFYFFRKYNAWREEAEYRFVCYTEKALHGCNDRIPLSIVDSIKGIIIGYNFRNINCVKSYCYEKHIPLFQMQYRNGEARFVHISSGDI
jgi:hypothetical protein